MAGLFKKIGKFLMGTPDKARQVSNLRPEQEGLYNQAVGAGLGPGAGGAFGDAADYYRGLLGNNSQDAQAFAAPAMRQYNEEIVPGLSEQFAGMGSGALSGSGFNLAQQQGNVDLSERLGALRANLRNSAASGLQNIGQLGLGNFSQWQTQPGTQGFLGSLAPALGTGIGSALGGPIGAAFGNMGGNWFSGNRSRSDQSPVGPNPKASPTIQAPPGSRMGGY